MVIFTHRLNTPDYVHRDDSFVLRVSPLWAGTTHYHHSRGGASQVRTVELDCPALWHHDARSWQDLRRSPSTTTHAPQLTLVESLPLGQHGNLSQHDDCRLHHLLRSVQPPSRSVGEGSECQMLESEPAGGLGYLRERLLIFLGFRLGSVPRDDSVEPEAVPQQEGCAISPSWLRRSVWHLCGYQNSQQPRPGHPQRRKLGTGPAVPLERVSKSWRSFSQPLQPNDHSNLDTPHRTEIFLNIVCASVPTLKPLFDSLVKGTPIMPTAKSSGAYNSREKLDSATHGLRNWRKVNDSYEMAPSHTTTMITSRGTNDEEQGQMCIACHRDVTQTSSS